MIHDASLRPDGPVFRQRERSEAQRLRAAGPGLWRAWHTGTRTRDDRADLHGNSRRETTLARQCGRFGRHIFGCGIGRDEHGEARRVSLWRDLGYAIGALLSGAVADFVGLGAAIHLVGGLTLASGLMVVRAMRKPRPVAVPSVA